MEKYEYLDHTADAKFRAYGKDFKEAITNAALAMSNLYFKPEKVTAINGKRVQAVGRTKETMLYEFLQSIIFLLETHNFLLSKIQDMQIIQTDEGKWDLRCRLVGDDVGKYVLDNHIKSATYSEMEIKEEKDKCMIQVVVDI